MWYNEYFKARVYDIGFAVETAVDGVNSRRIWWLNILKKPDYQT